MMNRKKIRFRNGTFAYVDPVVGIGNRGPRVHIIGGPSIWFGREAYIDGTPLMLRRFAEAILQAADAAEITIKEIE